MFHMDNLIDLIQGVHLVIYFQDIQKFGKHQSLSILAFTDVNIHVSEIF